MALSARADRIRRIARVGCALCPSARVALVALCVVAADSALGEPAGAELAFARHSRPVASLSLESLRQSVEPAAVRVVEPYESREVEFMALPFDLVLDAVYTDTWRSEEEILFTCRDGYRPTIPVERVLSHRAWLAFERTGRADFAIQKRESGALKRVELGPFYLVWENLDDPQMRQEADYGWPYQLVAVDLIRSRERFPEMMPPPDSPPEVEAGFAAFRIHCSKCHKVNGEGGGIGPELVAAASPLAVRDPDWLRTWIEDPSRIRSDARMPALNPDLPDRARIVDEILAYLGAMVAAGVEPGGG